MTVFSGAQSVPITLILGIIIIFGFYVGCSIRKVRLPLIIGYMVTGVILGPSVLNIVNDGYQEHLSFITELTLAIIAFNIGLELNLKVLKDLGRSIIYIIFAESFGAFILVSLTLYLLTQDIALSLLFGALAPASAPAGTVAVIQECKSKGKLTSALYAVVGFDDGLAIIIFGFAMVYIKHLLHAEMGVVNESYLAMVWLPIKEILFSIIVGSMFAGLLSYLVKKIDNGREGLILLLGFILISNSVCYLFGLSLILTNMITGFIIANIKIPHIDRTIKEPLSNITPLLFILFFVLAGAHLKIDKLYTLGFIGVVYILARSLGLVGGAWVGATVGKADDKIRRYLGLGILSQAGVAIGLALIASSSLRGLGKFIGPFGITSGDYIGAIALASVTVTSIFFEFIGPILTKFALTRANEIPTSILQGKGMRGHRGIVIEDRRVQDSSLNSIFEEQVKSNFLEKTVKTKAKKKN